MLKRLIYRLRHWLHCAGQITLKRLFRLLLRVIAVVALAAIGLLLWFVWWPTHTVPPLEKVDDYVYLDQRWGNDQHSAARQTYYFTPQGTSMPQGASQGALRYDWFVHLEMPLSEQRFAAPDHMRQYRFIVDPTPSSANPDQLPVGFTKHFDPGIGEYVLDITCAACHTGELHFTKNGKTTAIRIDGGQAMHAFTDMQRGSFAPELMAALMNTAANPWKFERFAKKVLKDTADYDEQKSSLKSALWSTVKAMLASGQNNPLRHLYPVREGYGRTDALGRIGNTAFGDHLVASNYQPGDAPVSYPYVWNIWKFDWVQYNGSVAQPLARNIGEALGVGAIVPLRNALQAPLPMQERFRTSVNIAGLQQIEHTLQTLAPPPWPSAILGEIDTAKADHGKQLFEQHCRECHGPHVASAARQQASAPLKPSNELEWRIEVIPLEHIGTDGKAAKGFVNRHYDLSATGLSIAEIRTALEPLLTRQLARNVRFRLREVIAERQKANLATGNLPELLASYPDPDRDPIASLPRDSFAQITATMKSLDPERPIPTKQPYDPLHCALACQTNNLLWTVNAGEQANAQFINSLDIRQLNEGIALNIVGILIKNRFYADFGIDYATQQCLEGYGALDLPQVIEGYKPRPLAGVWATPPFLHNGSVPTIYQMLLPPDQRDTQFYVGRREYDPVHLGYVTTPANEDDGGFWLDTTIPGNHNSGHAFAATPEQWQNYQADYKKNPLPNGVIGPLLTDDERFALIEYLKIHEDPATPADFQPKQCQLFGQSL